MNHKTCLLYLNSLCDIGILNKKIIGKSHVFSVNESYFWDEIKRLFEGEVKLQIKLKKDIISTFSERCIKIIIFGSYARKEETCDSDLDICFVIKKGSQNKIKKVLETYEPDFLDRYLCHYSPYLITEAKYNAEKLPIIKEIKKEGVVIYG